MQFVTRQWSGRSPGARFIDRLVEQELCQIGYSEG